MDLTLGLDLIETFGFLVKSLFGAMRDFRVMLHREAREAPKNLCSLLRMLPLGGSQRESKSSRVSRDLF